jgi:hypothetical protein
MMKKIIISMIILFLYGCANYEFVYKKNRILKQIDNQTAYSIGGDSKPHILVYMSQRLGINEVSPTYLLEITSTKKEKIQAFNKDSTASKNEISYEIKYVLKELKSGCKIHENTINSKNSYDSKSSGYSFNSDMAEADISNEVVEENINKFINYLNTNLNDMVCKIEN